MQVLLGILVLVHGLITTAIGAGSISNPRGVAVPGTDWYPVALGQSWMLQGDAAKFGAGLWLIAGIGLIATSAAILGVGGLGLTTATMVALVVWGITLPVATVLIATFFFRRRTLMPSSAGMRTN